MKLEKRWNDIILGREERVRQYFLKSADKQGELTPSETDTTPLSDIPNNDLFADRRIRIVDRFGLILQIFALRARS
jgi:hypothetical protein